MEVKFEHTAAQIPLHTRFVDYAIQVVTTLHSRNSVKKAIKKGHLLLNGEPAESGRFIQNGDVITHIPLPEKVSKIFELKLPVIYEDAHLALINKPAGYSVSGNYFRTIKNALPFNLTPSNEKDALPAPMPVHRLDNQTQGLLLIAKTQRTQIELGKQLEQKTVQKTYQAIVLGTLPESGFIDNPIDGKDAMTHFKVLETVNSLKYKTLSLVELNPETGRTHQLRIHLSEKGHAILGDKLYTPPELLFKGKGLFLVALGIQFIHPETGEALHFQMELPKKFRTFLSKARQPYNKLQG